MEDKEVEYYFMDDEIYYQGKKQPPRKVKCFYLSESDGIVKFYDSEGDSYTMPKERVFEK